VPARVQRGDVRRARVRFRVTVRIDSKVRRAIATVPEHAWTETNTRVPDFNKNTVDTQGEFVHRLALRRSPVGDANVRSARTRHSAPLESCAEAILKLAYGRLSTLGPRS
jgi:hypothetical protein